MFGADQNYLPKTCLMNGYCTTVGVVVVVRKLPSKKVWSVNVIVYWS